MDTLQQYSVLMQRRDANPRHWRSVWMKDRSERLIYLCEPVIKVSGDLVRAIERLDSDLLTAFLNELNERAKTVANECPEDCLGGEAIVLRNMVNLSVFPCIHQAVPALVLAGVVTALMDDLDTATTVICGNCETRLEDIRLDKEVSVLLCPVCDQDDRRWFQDIGCKGKDKRIYLEKGLRRAIGDCPET